MEGLFFDRIVALSVFAIALFAIITDKFDKAVVALAGALILILFGVLDIQAAINHVDMETIMLLLGMMTIVHVMHRAKFFDLVALHMARVTKGNPLAIFIIFALMTGLCSAFLNNVTTVLVMVPLTIQLTRGMGLNPFYFVLGEVFMTNIGGTATLIGDASNVMIGTAANLSFMDFLYAQAIPVFFVAIAVIFYLIWKDWKNIRPTYDNFMSLFTNNLLLKNLERREKDLTIDKNLLIKSIVVFSLTLIGFCIPSLPAALVALMGSITLMFLVHSQVSISNMLEHVEWVTLLFFAGLFIIVGGLKDTGLLDIITQTLVTFSSQNFTIFLLIILWATAIFSSVIDNIPFVALMIPIVSGIIAQGNFPVGADPLLLWWALSLGACMGGNGTLIGGSANVVAVGVARKEGLNITFTSFTKVGAPVLIISMIISSIFLIIVSS